MGFLSDLEGLFGRDRVLVVDENTTQEEFNAHMSKLLPVDISDEQRRKQVEANMGNVSVNGPMQRKKYWAGSPPSSCDLCKKAIINLFVDGRTDLGPWGFMCIPCHVLHGYGTGVGRGQKYEKQADGRWLKVGG